MLNIFNVCDTINSRNGDETMRKIGCLFLSILLICSCFSISVYSFYSENVLVYGVETVYSECYATEKTELEKFTDTSYVSLYQYNFDNKGYIYCLFTTS